MAGSSRPRSSNEERKPSWTVVSTKGARFSPSVIRFVILGGEASAQVKEAFIRAISPTVLDQIAVGETFSLDTDPWQRLVLRRDEFLHNAPYFIVEGRGVRVNLFERPSRFQAIKNSLEQIVEPSRLIDRLMGPR